MPSWKKVITSGSSAHLSHVTASANISGSSTSTGSFGNVFVDGDIDIVDSGTRKIGNGDEYLQFYNSAVYLFGNDYQFIKGRNDNQLFFMND